MGTRKKGKKLTNLTQVLILKANPTRLNPILAPEVQTQRENEWGSSSTI